ncbi:hypothetical protein IMSAGC014_02206 [Bacteroidaceae bacterium]|uniref:IS1096 element passenger TnpR family protein n=1 Tax=Prevotella sp. MGM2 TaxID=2033406 RepID=UPI000CEA3A3D|nr:hypothetical protein [Prevotella sp. MGM2]GAY30837.1 hypothetical protein PvtlMGM2_1690 [Prevotella sp. MGM2]GFI35685.1 hypothetical protein IMSAGC014_02206 [Bacteroidaceae bacterium]
MLLKIKFISDEIDGFLREIKIDSDANFLDLNKIILQSCGYPDDQMTSFHICNDEWERCEQITREDMADASSEDDNLYTMSDTPLADFIEDTGQKMEFVFDPFSERSFFLEVKDTIPGEHLKNAEVVRSVGDAPLQIAEMDLDTVAKPVKGGDFFSEDEAGEFYGNDQFSDDEFDLEGFEFTDGDPY